MCLKGTCRWTWGNYNVILKINKQVVLRFLMFWNKIIEFFVGLYHHHRNGALIFYCINGALQNTWTSWGGSPRSCFQSKTCNKWRSCGFEKGPTEKDRRGNSEYGIERDEGLARNWRSWKYCQVKRCYSARNGFYVSVRIHGFWFIRSYKKLSKSIDAISS